MAIKPCNYCLKPFLWSLPILHVFTGCHYSSKQRCTNGLNFKLLILDWEQMDQYVVVMLEM